MAPAPTRVAERPGRSLITAAWGIVLLLAASGIYLVLGRGTEILMAMRSGVLPPPESFEGPFPRRPLLAFLHILPGLLFVVLGPLQLARPIRDRFPSLHRWSGRVYLIAGVLIAYSAVRLVLNRSFGGPSETSAAILFAVLLLSCLGMAFAQIRRRHLREHREWMIRGFAIGLAVVTIRPVVGIYLAFSDYSIQEVLGSAFWISFTIHLIAAEVWVHLTRP